LTQDGVELVVDPVSLPYLEGAEVDYVEQLSGAQFVVHNPNAKTTCGCGSSFTA
jgi:iron-sulfur cluster insertion protein